MQTLFDNIKGDRLIWAIVALLAIFSFLPVYSAASNLAYSGSNGSTFSFFVKHFMHLFLGFSIMYGVHKIPYRYFRGLSLIMIPIVLILLIVTMFQGITIDGSNASRWIQIPIVGMSFQTSTLASVVLMVYVARYMSKIKDKEYSFKDSILPLWIPVFVVLGLILPANFSTAALIFSMVILNCSTIIKYIKTYPAVKISFSSVSLAYATILPMIFISMLSSTMTLTLHHLIIQKAMI